MMGLCLRVVFLIGLGIAPAWAAQCPTQPACIGTPEPLKVTVRFDKAEPTVDISHSRAWIRNRSRNRDKKHHPVGLTEMRLSHRLSATFRICSVVGRKNHCVYLAKVSLEAGFPDTKLFIAREYPPGSCEYQAIYAHEAEHVGILNAHQKYYLPILRTDLQRFAQSIKPGSGHKAEREQKKIMRQLDQWVKRKIRRLENSLKSDHAAIDSEDNYAKIQANCHKW